MRMRLLFATTIPILAGAIAACSGGVDPNAALTNSASSSSSTGGSSSSSTGGSSSSSTGGSSSSSSTGGSSSSSTGGSSSSSTGGPGSSSSSTGGSSSSSTGGPGSTLYQRLGGQLGIRGLVSKILADELKDADIASFFFFQVTSDPAHPSVAQLEDCLVIQFAEASGGPEVYTGHVSAGFACRSMAAAHQGLQISSHAFDKFVTIAAGTMKQVGVSDPDIAALGSFMNGTKAEVSSPNGKDKFTPP